MASSPASITSRRPVRLRSCARSTPSSATGTSSKAMLRQALQHTLDQNTAVRDIYQGYAYRQNGPARVSPGHRPGVPQPTRARLATALRRRPGPATPRRPRLGHQHHPGGLRRSGQGRRRHPGRHPPVHPAALRRGQARADPPDDPIPARRGRRRHRTAPPGGVRLDPGRRGRAVLPDDRSRSRRRSRSPRRRP